MSKTHMETITCPFCGKQSGFLVWDTINTYRDPDMKKQVRTKQAFYHKCPECNKESFVDYPTLYHQMEDHIMIYYSKDTSKAIDALDSMTHIGGIFKVDDDYRLRVVGSIGQLIEKLLIYDHGLDDRVVELMKFYLIILIQQQNPNFGVSEMVFDDSTGKLVFAFRQKDGDWLQVDFSEDMYNKIQEEFKEPLETNKEYVIDIPWAQNQPLKQ